MALDDLLKSFGALQQGVQQYAVTRAISSANDQVQTLNAGEQDEMAKRKQLGMIGNNLALALGGIGAPVSQIQSAVGAIKPEAFKSAEEMYMGGVNAGDQKLKDAGIAALSDTNKPKLDVVAAQGKNELAKQALANEGEIQKAQIMAGAKNKSKPLSDAQLKIINGFDEQKVLGTDILNRVDQFKSNLGPVAGRAPDTLTQYTNPEFNNYKAELGRWFDTYRKNITGAQASEKEMALLQKNQPTVKDTPEVLKLKMQTILGLGEQVRQKHLSNLGKAGRDVTQFVNDTPAASTQVNDQISAAEQWLQQNPNHAQAEAVRQKINTLKQRLGQ
jgi:hypothetical protein